MGNRLLQISTAIKEPKVSRDFDPYVLLSLKLEIGEKVPHLFWRLNNSKHMIDVGIRSDSGELASLAIVLYRDLIHSSAPKGVGIGRTTKGIPVFSLDSWQIDKPFNNSAYYSINHGGFSISLEGSGLYVTLFTDPIESIIGLPGVILCLFDHKRELCGFVIENLTSQEIEKISQFEKLWEEYR